MIVMDGEEYLTAQEACDILSVKPATLYAYVSRGLLSSYRQGIRRARLYRRADVERLTRLRGPNGEGGDDSNQDGDDLGWIPYV